MVLEDGADEIVEHHCPTGGRDEPLQMVRIAVLRRQLPDTLLRHIPRYDGAEDRLMEEYLVAHVPAGRCLEPPVRDQLTEAFGPAA